ncbi:MAG: SDR family oxidoreductase [Deltaproteobacteria bacterium]|nr:SDR family oxidoreductase [Deltaproteobacteria bacterium]
MASNARMEGKVAIVTGSARGTGATIARLFAEHGARVVVADVNAEGGESVAKEIGDAAIFVETDVTSEDSWANTVERAESHFGSLNVLVNNAAILHLASVEDTKAADFERLLAVNTIGPFNGIRASIEAMKRAGGGSVVNISSIDGLAAKNGVVAYATSKWGVRGVTKVAAVELGKYGIRVNVVCPEAGSLDMLKPYLPPGFDPELIDASAHRLLSYQGDRKNAERLKDVANMVLFLASDESRSCTGADFAVDSGYTMGRMLKGVPGS